MSVSFRRAETCATAHSTLKAVSAVPCFKGDHSLKSCTTASRWAFCGCHLLKLCGAIFKTHPALKGLRLPWIDVGSKSTDSFVFASRQLGRFNSAMAASIGICNRNYITRRLFAATTIVLSGHGILVELWPSELPAWYYSPLLHLWGFSPALKVA